MVAVAGAVTGAIRLPVAFEPNRGQFSPAFDFAANGSGYSLTLRSGRAEFVSNGSRVDIRMEGSRAGVRAEAESPLPGVVNYLRGRDSSRWITGIPTYGRVRYRGVYSGIDVVYYGSDGALENDFVVAPGADPRSIRMRIKGARHLRIDDRGDLVIATATGELRQHRPEIYQEIGGVRRSIAGGYAVRGNSVHFQVAAYDRRQPLVIDPVLTWGSFIGYNSTDTGEAVATDTSGNIYMAGATITPYGDNDVLLVKLSPDGATAMIKTYFGGSYDDVPHGIAVDSGGNIVIAGQTDSSDFPISGAAIPSYYRPGFSWDVFLIKLTPTAQSYLYSDLLGGSGDDIPQGVALDSAGNTYVAGYTNSPDFPLTKGVAQTTFGGGQDAFVTEFNAAGSQITYSTYLGGSANDYAYGIAVDSSGNTYITGATASTNFPVTSGAYQAQNGGVYDAFIAKLAQGTGTLSYATYFGGNGNDYGYGIAVDAGGIYFAGETASINFPVQNPAQKTFAGGTGDAFASKLDPAGASLIYSTYLGGTGEDAAYTMTVDAGGNAYIAGATGSTDMLLRDPFQDSNKGTANGLVAALDASGALLFSSYLGGDGKASTLAQGADYVNGIAVSCKSGLVVAGNTSSTNFPATAGTLSSTYQGGASDAFLARIGISTAVPSVADGGVVNGASFAAGPVAPGSLIAIYGSDLAMTTQVVSATPLPTALAGATIKINDTSAPVFFASPGQINVQVPYETQPGPATLTVAGACGASPAVSFQVAPAAPYLFPGAAGDALVYNQDNTLNSAANPAKAGSGIAVYMTGIGAVNNPVATGAAASATVLSPAALPNSATIGGTNAQVYFLGLTPQTVSISQANLIVPTLAPGRYPVVVTVNGVASNPLNVYVK